MERLNMTTHSARVLACATFASAMLAMTARPASAQSTAECLPDEGIPAVCGHVFTEGSTGDDTYQIGEGTPNIDVYVTDGDGNPVTVNSPQVNPTQSADACTPDPNNIDCGYYKFFLPEPPMGVDTYWVCIVLPGQSTDCSDTTLHPEAKQISATEGGQVRDFEIPSDEPPPLVWGNGTGTPGYWKNHSAAWPVDTIVLGDPALKTWTFTKEQAIAFMSKPVAGDKTYTIFASLVSAMLNVYGDANNPVCISAEIADAHHWFSIYGGSVGVGSGIKAKSDAWVGGATNSFKAAEPIHTQMDDYNNGKLCAPPRN